MKLFINVRINFTGEGKMFTVWPRPHHFLPGIEFYTGFGYSLSEAMMELRESLPESFMIDDEFSICSEKLEYAVIRPLEIVNSASIRIFVLT